MRNRKLMGLCLCLFICSTFSGGCIDGVRFGVQAGVETAIADTIETLITNALAPLLTPAE